MQYYAAIRDATAVLQIVNRPRQEVTQARQALLCLHYSPLKIIWCCRPETFNKRDPNVNTHSNLVLAKSKWSGSLLTDRFNKKEIYLWP